MASELVRQLIDSGIHFGHRVSRWNPKMRPYIFGKRNLIHIIDIRETVKGLLRAKKFIAQRVAAGEDVLFVGTKRQAKDSIRHNATRVNMPWCTERWLGGTLTNFRTIRSRLARLEELEAAEADGRAAEYSKKQASRNAREKRKIQRNLSGIRTMSKLPGVIVIVDASREHNALREARSLQIPTICLIDTDSDPDFADIPIPGNDDAMRAIDVIMEHLTAAVEEGMRGRTSPDTGADGQGPRKRSQRPVTARAVTGDSDGAKPDVAGESGAGEQANSDASEDNDSSASTPEPAIQEPSSK